MLTIVIYVVITIVVAAALFTLSLVLFGRGEILPPVAKGHTVTHLPEGALEGEDLRRVRLGMSARGYTMAEVDWVLEQAADEIDRLRARLGESGSGPGTGSGETNATAPASPGA